MTYDEIILWCPFKAFIRQKSTRLGDTQITL